MDEQTLRLRRKWTNGCNPKEYATNPEEIIEYVRLRLTLYNLGRMHDENLLIRFQEDFKDFDADDFKNIKSIEYNNLRRYLRCGGVYVPQAKGTTVAKSLFDLLSLPEYHTWTNEEVQECVGDLSEGPVTSVLITPTSVRYFPPPAPPRQNQREDTAPVNLPPFPHSLISQPTITPPIPPSTETNLPSSQRSTNTQRDYDHPCGHPDIVSHYQQPSRLIAEIAKMYKDDDRYDGSGSFSHKLRIFEDICKRIDLPARELPRAFPIVLKGLAQSQYYSGNICNMDYPSACIAMRTFFEGAGFYRTSLAVWNGVSLAKIIAKYPTKTMQECVQELVNELGILQHSLEPSLQTNTYLHNKIVTSCEGIPACRYAIGDPPDNLGELLNKLRSSISAYEKEQLSAESFQVEYPEIHYTDRRYHSNRGTTAPRLQGGRSWGNQRGRVRYNSSGSSRSPSRPPARNTCWVCKKEGCISFNHTQEERDTEKARFRARMHGRFKQDTGQKFESAYRQYVNNFEGYIYDDEEHLEDAFGVLLIHGEDEETGNTTDSYGPYDQTPTETECLFTSFHQDSLPPGGAKSLAAELCNRSYLHHLTAEFCSTPDDPVNEPIFLNHAKPRYGPDRFQGILVDTGAASFSTAGYDQFEALQRLDASIKLDESTKGMVNPQFGIGSTSSVGSARIDTPIGKVEFHVVQAPTPFLLCLRDLDNLGFFFNNLTNSLVSEAQKTSVPIVRRFGHPFLVWKISIQSFLNDSLDEYPSMLTRTELRRLHRRFGHPSVSRLEKILQRSGHNVEKQMIEHLTNFCDHCQRHSQSPGRFRFSLKDDLNFNASIIVDVFYIDGKPVLHIVDEATSYQAGRWLQNISSKHTWETLRSCWIDTYLGPPDEIVTDAGKNFVGKEFKDLAASVGTTVKIVPVEAHNSVGKVERYHAVIRRSYNIITAEIPSIDQNNALQMAFKATNDSAGPDGLIPTLLLYGAYPRMSEYDPPAPSVSQRSAAIKKAMTEIHKIHAKRLINSALNTRNGPNTSRIHDLPLNSDVLVWREQGGWKGPYKLLNVQGESCVVALPHANTTFRSTVVKPYYKDQKAENDPDQQPHMAEHIDLEGRALKIVDPVDPMAEDSIEVLPLPAAPPKRGRGRPRKNAVFLANPDIFLQSDEDHFSDSRHAEIVGLLEKGVFTVTSLAELPQGVRIFNSRFVDEVKIKEDLPFKKSRLVVQAYNDDNKSMVLTQSPTIQRISQRIILCIAAMKTVAPNPTNLYLRDISQAYVQSTTSLNRDFFIKPPRELALHLNLDQGQILQVVKPLYGIPEAGNHWFKTYHSHHVNNLGMKQSTYDPCLLHSNSPFGVVGLQTDDTLFVADADFAGQEEIQLQQAKFLAKDREILTSEHPLKFNGGLIKIKDNNITLTQERQCKNLSVVRKNDATTTSSRGTIRPNLNTKDQYVAQRARGAYIAAVSQPEAAYDLSIAAQSLEFGPDDVRALNKRVQWQIENPTRGLRFVDLEKKTVRLLAFTDASFANNKDLSSQIGYVLVLADGQNNANIVHWSSTKYKRVTRSVLASELYGMAHGFDMAAAVKSTVDDALEIDIPLILCTDSKSLYDCIVKLGTTQEKRLMIDVMCLRQAYERREIVEVRWIEGTSNPADSMTKTKPTNALKQLIDTNKIQMKVQEWVERP